MWSVIQSVIYAECHLCWVSQISPLCLVSQISYLFWVSQISPLFWVSQKSLYAKFHYADCHYADCRYAYCHYADCHYDDCRYAYCHYADCHYDECRYMRNVVAPNTSSFFCQNFLLFSSQKNKYFLHDCNLLDTLWHTSQKLPCGLYYKSCTIVIYNRNHSTIIGSIL